jgi:hypothetical protein
MCLRVTVRQRSQPLRFCKRYFDAYAPLDDLWTAFDLIDGFKFGPLDVRDVSVRMKLRADVSEAFIVRARAPRRVRPGQRIRIGLQLQRSRAGRQRVSFVYRVPRSVRPGRRLLTVRGAGAPGGADLLEELFGETLGIGGGGSGPVPSRRGSPRSAARRECARPSPARARDLSSTATAAC